MGGKKKELQPHETETRAVAVVEDLIPNITSMRLEAIYWAAIEAVAARDGVAWRRWVSEALADRPKGKQRGQWLKLKAFQAFVEDKALQLKI